MEAGIMGLTKVAARKPNRSNRKSNAQISTTPMHSPRLASASMRSLLLMPLMDIMPQWSTRLMQDLSSTSTDYFDVVYDSEKQANNKINMAMLL